MDPISLAAVTAVLGAVGGGMANEAGKWAWESAGGLARRIAGREVPAPVGAAEREAVARLLVDGAGRDAAHARVLAQVMWGAPRPAQDTAVPRQLPPSVRFFTDRQGLMRRLDTEAARRSDGRPRVVVLHGPEGIGTSALAVHWGCRETRRYPDGQLYADLRGGSPAGALDAATVLRRFLRQLGVGQEDVPASTEDRIAVWRARVADRRLLVVLDHAHSAAQVGPLLSSASGVLTVVVARRPLPGLDAVPVPVGPLADKDAVRLLTDLAGKQAVARARRALPSVLARCGGSPFALRAAAPRLAARLQEERPASTAPGEPVRTAVESLYHDLPEDAARLYRLLAARPWPAISPGAAAAAGQIGEDAAVRLLDELAGRNVVETTNTGRYHYRPAVRNHAEQIAVREDGILACAAAVDRTVTWYLHLAVRADRAALPQRWHLGPLYTRLGPASYTDGAQALAAVNAELGNLLEAVRAAEESGDLATVCQLCEALWSVQLKSGRHDELLPALRAGVRAADALDPASRMAGRMHTQLALALTELQNYGEAEAELRAAARAEERAGHLRGRATAVETLGLLRLRQWRFEEALDLFDEAGGILAVLGEGDEGARDLPRARALLERHRGRALRGLGRREEARERLETARLYFRASGEAYNLARTLTDLAGTLLDADDRTTALPLIEQAIAVLEHEQADYHLAHLRTLRERCLTPPG